MKKDKLFLLSLVLVTAMVLIFPRQAFRRNQSGPAVRQRTFLLRFGVNDSQDKDWSGRISVLQGKLVRVESWHFAKQDSLKPDHSWITKTRIYPPRPLQPWEHGTQRTRHPRLEIPGLLLTMDAGAECRLAVDTREGKFEFSSSVVSPQKPIALLDGRVVIEESPTYEVLTNEQSDNDMPAIAIDSDGSTWISWLEYRGQKQQIMSRRFSNGAWSEPKLVYVGSGADGRTIFLTGARL